MIQDFVMPDVSNCMKLSPDGQYLMACGTYKPVMKCYDLEHLSVKFERGMDYEAIRLEILSDDYSKVSALCNISCILLMNDYALLLFSLKCNECSLNCWNGLI